MKFEANETLEQARARNIDDALREDLGTGDWTAQLVPAGQEVWAQVVVREDAVLCGRDWFAGVFAALDANARIEWRFAEGADMPADSVVCRIQADSRALLTAERPALNFLQLLSATASVTRRHVHTIEGASPNPRGCAILDTRKTIPGLRLAQKYAVRVGGGVNHRLGLGDAALIKDNHVAAAGSVLAALQAVRAAAPGLPCEVEVDSLEQLDEILGENVELVLLDNFPVWQTQIAVQRRDARAPGTKLESSGGLSLDSAAAYAATGVDFLAIGALTHSVRVLDVGLDT